MPYDLGNRKHVFIDWSLIEPGYGVAWGGRPSSWEMPHGIRITVHPPRLHPQPLICADRPWEAFINIWSTVLEDGDRFRLYYESYQLNEKGRLNDEGARVAYAESSDGLQWTKPAVGADGTNLVYTKEMALGRGCHGATVFSDPGAIPEQRYKLIHMGREPDSGELGVFGAVSPDGLQWQPLPQPLVNDYMSDTQTVARFDPHKKRYVAYFRGWEGMDIGRSHGRRTIAYAETEEFDRWPRPQTVVAPEGSDNPDTDIYNNAYTPWPGTTDAHLMFASFFQRSPDVLEVHLLTSRDGVRWHRLSRKPLIAAGEPGSQWEGGLYAGCGLTTFRPGEWSLLLGPQWFTHNQFLFQDLWPSPPPDRGYLCRAVWRADGLTSLEARTQGGCTTLPLSFTGRELQLNAWTRFGGEVLVELAEEKGTTIAGHAFADCDPITGDCLQHIVTWQGRSDLSAWKNKPLRLRFKLRRARLHALQFV